MFTQHRPFEGMDFDLNLGLIIGSKNNFIIDTGFGSESVAPIIKYITEYGHLREPIIINTHSHFDHVWGNCTFPNSMIISHPLCRKFADRDWDNDLQKWSTYPRGNTKKHLPNTTFEGVMHFPEDGVTIFHSPGHSVDCISVYDEIDKILYAGDNIGDTQDNVIPYIETDIPTFERLIEIYKRYPFEICISGHNKPQGKDVLSRMENQLEASWKQQVAKYGLPV